MAASLFKGALRTRAQTAKGPHEGMHTRITREEARLLEPTPRQDEGSTQAFLTPVAQQQPLSDSIEPVDQVEVCGELRVERRVVRGGMGGR